jgi:DNA-binding NtrC family response regulator
LVEKGFLKPDRRYDRAAIQNALDTLRDGNSIDLVITDHVMPHMTGLQLAQAIEAEWPVLPVVLATGFAEIPSDAMKLPRLPKPFGQSELALALVRAKVDTRPGEKARVLPLRRREQ